MSPVIVVSQPMFFPWIGLFEQVRLSDIFVHYDDVQLPQGRSFISRVQIKSVQGLSWLSAPIDRKRSGSLINEVALFNEIDWRSKHLASLRHAYARAPHFDLMFQIAKRIYGGPPCRLSEFNIAAIEQISRWLGLTTQFVRSSALGVAGASTERLVAICQQLGCNVYVTGLGALKYLQHEKFEERGISVRYMDYIKAPYAQGQSEFTPYVSILDAIAHCGEQTRDLVCSNSVYWKDFIQTSSAVREDSR
jgi:hypothetical protein